MPSDVASGTPINGYSLRLDRPFGTGAGDLLVAFASIDGAGLSLVAPGGWVDLGGYSVGTAASGRTVRAWYRYATTGEPASYQFSANSTNAYRICAVRITGAPASNPIAVPAVWNGQARDIDALPVPTQVAPTTQALQLAFVAANAQTSWVYGAPEGFTQLAPADDSNNASIAWRKVLGATSPASWTAPAALFSWVTGSLIINGGAVVSVSRSMRSMGTLDRTVKKLPFERFVTAGKWSSASRVVVRQFTAVIGGGTEGSTPDAFEDSFTDSFVAEGSTPVFGSSLRRGAIKQLNNVSAPTRSPLQRQVFKYLSGQSAPARSLKRGVIKLLRAHVDPAATTIATNIGRLFGVPGVVDITIRLAGEIRARVRRR